MIRENVCSQDETYLLSYHCPDNTAAESCEPTICWITELQLLAISLAFVALKPRNVTYFSQCQYSHPCSIILYDWVQCEFRIHALTVLCSWPFFSKSMTSSTNLPQLFTQKPSSPKTSQCCFLEKVHLGFFLQMLYFNYSCKPLKLCPVWALRWSRYVFHAVIYCIMYAPYNKQLCVCFLT